MLRKLKKKTNFQHRLQSPIYFCFQSKIQSGSCATRNLIVRVDDIDSLTGRKAHARVFLITAYKIFAVLEKTTSFKDLTVILISL